MNKIGLELEGNIYLVEEKEDGSVAKTKLNQELMLNLLLKGVEDALRLYLDNFKDKSLDKA